MFFLWPQLLWLMLALPLLLAAYWWLLHRRSQRAVRYSSLGVVRAAVAGRQWRRHVPPALLLLACAALLFGAARPVARVPLPWSRSTILLAMDVSLSMRVNDVLPSRLEAAQAAAKLFLRDLPKNIEVGLITFAGSTQVAQQATLDRESLIRVIDGFQMQMGTAIGNAIVLCLAELFPEQGIEGEMTLGNKQRARSIDENAEPTLKAIKPVEPGSYPYAAIILLSDGRRTVGVDTLEAAKMAADRGVRVYVVGLGTAEGEVATPEGIPIYLQLDEEALREVARMTRGEYHHAGTADRLQSVYQQLGSRIQVVTRETELTALAALLAGLLTLTAGTLSVLWFGRIA